MIVVFTDGSFANNVAGIGIHFPNGECKDVSEPFTDRPTSQRAELHAILTAIRMVRHTFPQNDIHIYSDSQYAIKSCTEWMPRWQQNQWKASTGKPVANQDLMIPLSQCLHNVQFTHVTAHTSWTDVVSNGNREADRLAKAATKKNKPS